jgi:hypothetical protein
VRPYAQHDPQIVGRYVDTGGMTHDLVVREADDGWQALDVCGEIERVIDTLAGGEDGRPQAEAITRDYLATTGNVARATRRAADEAISEISARERASMPSAQPSTSPAGPPSSTWCSMTACGRPSGSSTSRADRVRRVLGLLARLGLAGADLEVSRQERLHLAHKPLR